MACVGKDRSERASASVARSGVWSGLRFGRWPRPPQQTGADAQNSANGNPAAAAGGAKRDSTDAGEIQALAQRYSANQTGGGAGGHGDGGAAQAGR